GDVGGGKGRGRRAVPAGALVGGLARRAAIGAAHADGCGAHTSLALGRILRVAGHARRRPPAEADRLQPSAGTVGRGPTGVAGVDARAAERGALETRKPSRVDAGLLDLSAVLCAGDRVWSGSEHEQGKAEA